MEQTVSKHMEAKLQAQIILAESKNSFDTVWVSSVYMFKQIQKVFFKIFKPLLKLYISCWYLIYTFLEGRCLKFLQYLHV